MNRIHRLLYPVLLAALAQPLIAIDLSDVLSHLEETVAVRSADADLAIARGTAAAGGDACGTDQLA